MCIIKIPPYSTYPFVKRSCSTSGVCQIKLLYGCYMTAGWLVGYASSVCINKIALYSTYPFVQLTYFTSGVCLMYFR